MSAIFNLQGLGWLVMFIALLPLYLTWRTFAPWVPIKRDDLARVLALAELKPGEWFADLGCGEGRVVEYIAEHSEAETLGVELAWPMFLWAKIRSWLHPNPRIHLRFANLFKVPLDTMNVVYVFGMPKTVMGKFQQKCLKELPKGARVISYCFSVEGWEPTVHDRAAGPRRLPIFRYDMDVIRKHRS